MYKFFCPTANISTNKILIDNKEQVHHIKDVLRLKVKDNLMIFDEQGREYICIIEKVASIIILGIERRFPLSSQKEKVKIAVACAIPKKSKMDDIVDKLTQLGVDRITPLETERVIVKLNKNKRETRLLRWQKIALNAVQQSQRSSFTVIEPVKDVRDVIRNSGGYDLKLIPTLLAEGRKTLKDAFRDRQLKNVIILIGPEGDFADGEIKLARENGFIPVTLGDTVLRVDTAAIAVVSYIKLALAAPEHQSFEHNV